MDAGRRRGAAARAGVVAAAVVAGGLAAGLLVPADAGERAGGAVEGPSAERGAACDVHVMRWRRGSDDGTVMDIERVDGLGTVYYGSFERPRPDGTMVRRAYVWFGLDAAPVRVGPRGTAYDIAFELTSTGLVNGQSAREDGGRERGWVQDLRTGRLTWADASLTRRPAPGMYFRRINKHGVAAGTLDRRDGGARAVLWPRADREPRELPGGRIPLAEAWAVSDRRDVVGSYAVPLGEEAAYPQGVIWNRDGTRTRLKGLGFDSYPRVMTNDRASAGTVWWGPYDGGHGEAGYWPRPRRVEALGLLPGGGFSGFYGMSQAGWATGVADVFDPDDPLADPDSGAVDHAVMWTGSEDGLRVLPSPYGVREGLTDWRDWYNGVAHGVHTGLDQVGGSGHVGTNDDGRIRYAPTVWTGAGSCGEVVATTHTAFWEEPGFRRARPAGWDAAAQRERISRGW